MEENKNMERFDLVELEPGEELLVTTETESTYHLLAESALETVGETRNLFRGLRLTRESDHDINGRPELIENEPAILITRSGDLSGILRTGDTLDLRWDFDHPESKSWDRQFGPKFQPLYTSRIVGIELVPVQE